MTKSTVQISISLDALADSVAQLDLPEKLRLLERLEEQIAQAEEDLWERDEVLQAQIREARAAYRAGDSVTLKA